jgi:hypothetical protein
MAVEVAVEVAVAVAAAAVIIVLMLVAKPKMIEWVVVVIRIVKCELVIKKLFSLSATIMLK